ncbi:UNVERIFIED_CONTAM: tRNA(adenine(34)) deaminase, chloroplastic [Sesamum radiatum]|uniref:tRNA(adenine(34)) deaminase n=1 Tax=Sesamum radiatum TaxID=300843 RepID=A0AAW2JRN3_SESRA
MISGGLDRCYYARLPVCDVDRSCYCDKVCNFKEKSVGGRKGGFRKCMVFEERSERYDLGRVDEAEAVLSLLTEDIGEECFRVRKEARRLAKNPTLEKREDGEVSNKCRNEKKRVDLGVLESELRCEYESVVSSRKKDNRKREERIRLEEEREETRKAMLQKEHMDALLRNRTAREKEERETLLKTASEKAQEKQERESMLRKENWKVSSRTEEREDLLRREEHRQKMRRDGSSCSSYYSLSSTGDYDSDNEIELSEGRFLGASLTTMSAKKELYSGSSVAESDFRKKSEKKLVDVVEGKIESKQETSQKESKFPMAHESDFGRSSDYYVSYDDRKEKSTGNTEIDEERKNQLLQRGDEVSRQSETRLNGKSEMSAKVGSSSQEIVEEHQAAVGISTREDEYQRHSRKVAEVSEIQDTDIRKTSISQQRYETSVKEEAYSTNILSSINNAAKQQQQYDQASGLVESRGKSQQLTKQDGKSIIKRQSGKFTKQEENVKLGYGSSSESKELHSQTHATIIKRDNSRNISGQSNQTSVPFSGDSSSIYLEDRNKNKSQTIVRAPSNLQETGELSLGSKVGSANESSEFTLHEDMIGSAVRLEKSSSHYVGEFFDQEPEPRHDIQQSGTEGPSDEMWNVDESSAPELSKAEVQDDTSKAGNAIIKRTGRSLWNIIGDIVRLRWASHSESHSSGRKTGGRSSPNQSTSSETWFSGHEAEDNEEVTGEKEKRSITQGLYGSHQEDKILSQVEEGSSSSTSEGHLKQVGTNAPSSSVVPGSYTPPISISLPSEGKSRAASSAAPVDSISSPALRLQRSPIVRAVSETGEANASNSSMSQQLNTGSVEQPESVVNEGEVKRRKLQRNNQVVKDRFDEWEEAYRLEAEQRKIDEMFMREALLEAQKAADNWEVPVGAVLVHKGKIVARGCNLVEELRDSTAHAEMICIREGSNMLRTWRLSETTLYVTLEPCPMCAGAILQARIDTVVWGAPNKLLGADGSWIRLFPSGDGGNDLEQTDKPAAPVHPFHPKIIIRRGVLAAECADAMQQFFKLRRKKDKKPEAPSSPPTCLPISHRPSKFLAKMHDAFHLMFCL